MKYLHLIAIALVFLSGSSFAADAPNVLGTWKASSGVYSKTGTDAKKAAPVLSQQPWQSEFKITDQKGRVFNGATKRPDGSELLFAGAFSINGKNFTISADRGILMGTYESGKLEYCGSTISTEYNLAFCSTMERVK